MVAFRGFYRKLLAMLRVCISVNGMLPKYRHNSHPLNCLSETEQGKINLRCKEFLNVILTVSLTTFPQSLISLVQPMLKRGFKAFVGSKISLISIWLKNKIIYVKVRKIHECNNYWKVLIFFKNFKVENFLRLSSPSAFLNSFLFDVYFQCGMLIVLCTRSKINSSFGSLLRTFVATIAKCLNWRRI